MLADAQNDPDIEAQAVRPLLGRRGDALLITPVDRRRSGDRGGAGGAARAAGPVRHADAHYVGIDHDHAITDLLTHLTGTGRTRLELIGSDPSTSWERQTAFTTRAAQIDPLTAELVLLGDYSVEWGRAAAGRILDRWPDVDAMVCANDLIGIGVLQELHRRGVPVPGRVAVTGFDDTLLAAASEPSRTRVRQPVARVRALLLRKPVLGRGADGVVPSGGGWCRPASDSVQQRLPTSRFLRLCWSAACPNHFRQECSTNGAQQR